MIKAFLCSFLILFCTVIIETSILSNINFLPAVPDFVLMCSMYFSLTKGKLFGQVTGFTSGMLLDFVSGAPFGFNTLFRTIIGYFSGLFGKSLNYSGFLVPALIGLIGTLVKVFLIWIISLFFKSIIYYDIFSFTFLFELISNVLLTPLVFRFLRPFNKFLCSDWEDK